SGSLAQNPRHLAPRLDGDQGAARQVETCGVKTLLWPPNVQRSDHMKPELFWLALTATMTGLFWIPYVLNRVVRSGIPGAFMTPPMDAAPIEAEWARRAKRAHSNA